MDGRSLCAAEEGKRRRIHWKAAGAGDKLMRGDNERLGRESETMRYVQGKGNFASQALARRRRRSEKGALATMNPGRQERRSESSGSEFSSDRTCSLFF